MSDPAPKAIFLSYARDDAAAARRLAEALRSSGLEVWFDENELRGGDSWDAKIRKQIDECALFIAIISRHTDTRTKGYFRLEWKLAVDQTHLLAEGVPFIAPVVIDDTRESGASVPAEFLRVQWTRLPGALPTPQFVEQVKRLLAAPQKSAPEPGRPRPEERGRTAATPKSGGIPVWAWLAAVLAIGGAATFFATRSSPRQTAAPPAAAAKPADTAPVSEARQLVAKARALYEPWDLASGADFTLAEQLLKRAVELDPADGEAWAAYALLSCGKVVMSHDNSDARKAAARDQAERAIKLAPDSPQARFARAFSLRFSPQTEAEAIRLLREEAARQPTNRFVVRTLGAALRNVGELEQSLVYFDKAAALPGNDPVTQYNRAITLFRMQRFTQSEAAIDEALAVAPSYAAANRQKIILLLEIRGDLPRAQAHLAKVPPAFFLDDEGAHLAYLIALYSREPAKALEALRQAREYLYMGSAGTGPKALLTGIAHELMGNKEAAQTDFRAALRLVDERLVAQPNASRLLYLRTKILAHLGETAAVEPLLRDLRQRVRTGDTYVGEYALAELLVLSNKHAEALSALESYYGKPRLNYVTRTGLRYNPLWDPLRGNPRFEALLKTSGPKK